LSGASGVAFWQAAYGTCHPREGWGYVQEVRALFDRMGAAPSAEKQSTNATIVALLKADVWGDADAIYSTDIVSRSASALNWKAGQYNLVENGTIDWTLGLGFHGDGVTGWLKSNFNPSTAVAPKFTQNRASLGFGSASDGQGNGIEVSCGGTSRIRVRGTSNQIDHGQNFSSGGSGVNSSTAVGMVMDSRTGAAGSEDRI